MRTSTMILAAALAALPACSCDTPPPNALDSCQAAQVLPLAVQTDILFVIDDSGSMAEEQSNLSANLGAFIDTLAASPVADDFRIGVTTTSVENFDPTAHAYPAGPSTGVPYPAGALVAVRQDASGLGVRGAFVYDAAAYAATGGWGGARVLDKGSPTLARDFKANVLVGLSGSGKEQPFRVARLALSDRLADANQGFLRPGARLAVVFVTDEDDCSDTVAPFAASNDECHAPAVKGAVPPILDPPADFAAFLLGPVDGELRDVAVGAIAGFDPNGLAPSCGVVGACADNACATAYDEGDRFAALQGLVGGARMRLGSICDTSFRTSLAQFAQLLMPTTMPLSGAPADWRMLAVSLSRAGGGSVACAVAEEGSAAQATADAVYSPPRFGRPAMLTFQRACALGLGDRIDVRIVCAG
ncbi:MAG TPA: hypothetical protein VFP50_01735 [Anaeromyxobacteraceae bacterium]|nr:hypothetical protein [Anaeromyxobacteraceae bacterium]